MIALTNVDSVGENSDREYDSIRSAIVSASTTELREWCSCSSMVHNFVFVVFLEG